MNDMQARTYVVSYLKERNIFYQNIRGGSSLLVGLTGLEHCPGELLESSFDFYQTCLEARVYFGESVSGWLAKRPIDSRSCIGCLISSMRNSGLSAMTGQVETCIRRPVW